MSHINLAPYRFGLALVASARDLDWRPPGWIRAVRRAEGLTIIGTVALWLIGLLSMAVLFTALRSLSLMFLLLPWSVGAALLVAALIGRGGWSPAADVGETAGTEDGDAAAHEDLDAALEQSFPASDPPSFSTGIARVHPAA